MATGRIKGITIELGADASKFTKALAEVDKSIKHTQTNLRDVEKALKMDPGNADLIKDKQYELSKAIEETKSKLEKEKEALAQMKNTEGFDANSQAARDLQTQIDLDTAALKELEAQARQSSSVLGMQMQAAGQKIQEVGEKIHGVGEKLAGIGRAMTTYVTTPIVGGFAAAVKTTGDFDAAMSKVQAVSGATAEEVEQLRQKAKEMGETTKFSASESAEALNYMAMAGWKTEQMLGGIEGVMNLAAAAGEDLGTTSDIVTDALTAFGMSAEQSSRFADILASAASNANTNVSMMGESFKYAAAPAGALGYSAEDVAIALGLMANSGIKADMAGTSLRNMFLRMAKPTKESQAAMDRLGISLSDGAGNMYSFRDIMDQLRESFQNINMSAEEYESILDNLDIQLQNGDITQKQYNKDLEELNKQAFGAEGAEKARAAAMLGGTRAMSGLLAIANASEEDYKKLTSAIDNSSQSFAKLADGSVVPLSQALADGSEVMETYSGAAEAMSKVMLDNIPGQLTLIKSQIEGLAISYGDILEPKIRKALTAVSEFIKKLSDMSTSEKEQIIKIAALVAAIGPVLLIVGKVVASIGSIITVGGKLVAGIGTLMNSVGGISGALTALAGPVGIVVAAIGALTAGFVYLYNTNDKFRASVQETVAELKNNFAKVVETVKPKLEALAQAFQGLMEMLAPLFEFIFTTAMGVINGIIEAISPIVDVVTNVIELITNLVQAFFALIQGDFSSFGSFMMAAVQNVLNAISGIIQAIIAFWIGFFKAFGVNLKQLFTTIWEAVKVIVKTKIDNIKEDIVEVWTAIKEWVVETLEFLHDKFKEIFNKIKEAVSEKIDRVKETIINGIEAAVDYIRSLPEKFYNWGSEMVQNLIDGIQSKIDAVKAKVKELASAIAGYIHFSEPDVGPLSNFHEFMPDMIDLMVKGIDQGIPRLQSAMNGLAGSMVPQIQNGASSVANTNNININVYGAQGQDPNALVDIIEERLTENMMRRGAAFG